MRTLAIVALGSNIQPETYLPWAVQRLAALGAQAVSRVYQNPAQGGRPQPDYLNAAVALWTSLEADGLRQALREVEAALGRERTQDKYAPRTIDLDLLLLGDQVERGPTVRLPDPELLELAHLAVPASEVAPDAVHPTSGETLRAIADRLRPLARLTVRTDVTRQVRQVLAQERAPQ